MPWLLLVATLLLSAPAPASAASVATTPHFSVQLIAESDAPAPGHTVDVALVVSLANGWHTYWRNPGSTGLPPEIHWSLPRGITAGALRFPTPRLVTFEGIPGNVYTGDATFLSSLSLPTTLKRGEAIPVGLDLQLLVCSNGLCVPESVQLDKTLVAGDGMSDTSAAATFRDARAAMPEPLAEPASYDIRDGQLSLVVPLDSANVTNAVAFIANDGAEPGGQQFSLSSGAVRIVAPAGKITPGAVVRGVVRVGGAQGQTRSYAFVASQAAHTVSPGFWLILAGAILGGLLLNLMPCVFPILSLKALALVRAGAGESEARVEAVGYTMGAVAVLLALGGTVLVLKRAGHAVGWAFQLQDPMAVGCLVLLTVAIATNLAGLYELPSPAFSTRHRRGFVGGVATGALAAFIATPCTGPFMAGALGAALVLPTLLALAVFAGLGLGIALPFLCLGFIGPMRRLLPRPGGWMLNLRRLLSLPMFATAVGLSWIVGRETGLSAMTAAVSASVLLGVSLWWLGLRQHAGQCGYPALVPILASIALLVLSTNAVHAAAQASATLSSTPYSTSRLAALRANHRPVFVYLTADWCLTCKVNEATSLSSTDVANAFAKAHVAVLEGDWTNGNPEITRLLSDQGRAGVPLYLWYPVDGPPQALPQVLTPTMLVNLVATSSPKDNRNT